MAHGAATPEFREGSVTDLPFPDGAFDAAVCTQVYEYVEDMPLALREAARVLRPGGRLVVLDTDWDSIVWRSSDDARMARVLTGLGRAPGAPRSAAASCRSCCAAPASTSPPSRSCPC